MQGIRPEPLLSRVNSLIDKAHGLATSKDFGAVNWAMISVIDVLHVKSLIHDQEYVEVVVSEASPECELAYWLTKELDEKDVIIRTEW